MAGQSCTVLLLERSAMGTNIVHAKSITAMRGFLFFRTCVVVTRHLATPGYSD
jgi:hypothetical protein